MYFGCANVSSVRMKIKYQGKVMNFLKKIIRATYRSVEEDFFMFIVVIVAGIPILWNLILLDSIIPEFGTRFFLALSYCLTLGGIFFISLTDGL